MKGRRPSSAARYRRRRLAAGGFGIAALVYLLSSYSKTLPAAVHLVEKVDEAQLAEDPRWIGDAVQDYFYQLQFPPVCHRLLLCNLQKTCGFGCQLHHVAHCFTTAVATNRTMVLEDSAWSYSNELGWAGTFEPLTNCSRTKDDTIVTWSPETEEAGHAVLVMPIVDGMQEKPYEMLNMPRNVFRHVHTFHEKPHLWWIGQVEKYLMRPNPDMQALLDEQAEAWKRFTTPFVGVHVRRTDKVGSEANRYEAKEYMAHVMAFYRREIKHKRVQVFVQPRVFLACDDPATLNEFKYAWPNVEFFYGDGMHMAAPQTRYSDASLKGVVSDIYHLAQTAHLVCTLSSQICRLAYELMQANRNVDATRSYVSLDHPYYFGGQMHGEWRVVLEDWDGTVGPKCPHYKPPPGAEEQRFRPEGARPLKKGDVVEVTEDAPHFWSKGVLVRDRSVEVFFPNDIAEVAEPEGPYPDLDLSYFGTTLLKGPSITRKKLPETHHYYF